MGCGASKQGELVSMPCMLNMMQGMMRNMMNPMMTVPTNQPDGEATYKEVSDYMVPAMFNANNKDMGYKFPNGEPMKNPRIDWKTFCEYRPYCVPGYVTKAPQVGDDMVDAPVLSLKASGPSSTLMTEVRKLGQKTGARKVCVAFDGITCPFYRAYAAEDLYKACGNVPILHVYQMEAEPIDTFNAGGSQTKMPMTINPPIKFHKNAAERRDAAERFKAFISKWEGDNVTMFIDGMDDALETIYESRPWRWHVVDVASGKLLAKTGLAPFNMDAKIGILKKACQ